MSPAMVMLIGCTAPAPSPCTARNTINAVMFQAAAQKIEPSRNRPMPSNMIGLRPTMSASLP